MPAGCTTNIVKAKMTRFSRTQINTFVDYCWDFYGPDGIYPELLPGLTKAEIEKATTALSSNREFGAIDSRDRELCRDYLRQLHARRR